MRRAGQGLLETLEVSDETELIDWFLLDDEERWARNEEEELDPVSHSNCDSLIAVFKSALLSDAKLRSIAPTVLRDVGVPMKNPPRDT